MKNFFWENGLYFSCQRCSACCRYEPGYVFLTVSDLVALQKFLKIDREMLIKKYCRFVHKGDGFEYLSLQEQKNYDCIFWENGGCSVYPSRPLQCITYPFWESLLFDKKCWDAQAKNCPGINTGAFYSAEKIQAILKKNKATPIIFRRYNL